jgi:hypothetical protein
VAGTFKTRGGGVTDDVGMTTKHNLTSLNIDVAAATDFLTGHGRQLDRLRLLHAGGETSADAVLAALDAYRNADGGYGWGLEPDLRDRSSQPGGALHAFEVFAEVAPTISPHASALCDWLQTVALPDGGIPFALPVDNDAACAPFWVGADHAHSSLHITAAVTAMGHRVAKADPAVRTHPWLAASTAYCLETIASRDRAEHTLELMYSLWFLDEVADSVPGAADHIRRLGAVVPADGLLHVDGGLDDEFIRPLDIAPFPGTPVRALFADHDVDRELERLASRQQADGGWPEEFASYSPVAALEWRGYLTVRAVTVLAANS